MNCFIRTAVCALFLSAALLLSGCGIVIIESPADTDGGKSTAAIQTPSELSPVETTGTVTKIDNTAAHKVAAEAHLAAIPAEDYEGASFFITAPRTDVIDPLDIADSYSLAKHKRNQTVEAGWNINLVTTNVEEGNFAALVRESVLAEEYYSDLMMIPQYLMGTFLADGSLMNLRSLPFLDLSKEYFDQSSIEAAAVGNAVYGAAGPASFEESTLTAVFFNRDLFTVNQLALPYDSVYDGTWTWDTFFAFSQTVSSINGENGTAYSAYATQYAAEMLPSVLFFSAGSRFVQMGDTAPVIAYSEADATAASYIQTLFQNANMYKYTADGMSHFHKGNSLFLLDRLYLMTWMINGTHSWGILPMPKASAEQTDYISLADECVLFFATPKNNLHAARTSYILSALNAASYGVISDAYVTYAMHHVLRDNDSANMLEILINTRTYDFAFSFGRIEPLLANASYRGMQNIAAGTSFATVLKRIPNTNKQMAQKYSGCK